LRLIELGAGSGLPSILIAKCYPRITVIASDFPDAKLIHTLRENVTRMHAIGSPVFRRRLRIYAISAGLAGIAGALLTQTTQFVALQVLSFQLSGSVLVMLILGGVGRLYGAFIGVPLYMIAQDRFAQVDPVYWYFWIGLLLVLMVVFARGGVLGVAERLRQRFSSRSRA